MSFVLYGSETWSLIQREEDSLGGTGERVLRKIFGYMMRVKKKKYFLA
jgi:hypothetical protein